MSTHHRAGRVRSTYFQLFLHNALLWVACLLLLQTCRLGFLVATDADALITGLGELLASQITGLRFDMRFTTLWFAPLLIVDVLFLFYPSPRWRRLVQATWVSLWMTLGILLTLVAIDYYREYGDTFNYHLFGIVEDDFGAVMQTVLKEYNLLPKLAIWLLASGLITLMVFRFAGNQQLAQRLYRLLSSRSAVYWTSVLLLPVLVIGAARGGLTGRPIQERDAGVTTSKLLNKSVLIPHASLYYTLQKYAEDDLGAVLGHQDIRQAVQAFFHTDVQHNSLDAYLATRATGASKVIPRHIFLIVMESYHLWPMLPDYATLGVSDGVSALAQEGMALHSFLPASTGTMRSLQTLITGLPSGGLRINYEATSNAPYPTSLAEIFDRLGYRSLLYFGGYLSWHRLGEFSRDQGFHQVYGGEHMQGYGRYNEWGIEDRGLFRFIADHHDDSSPSLTLIMTTSNHPPYDLDLAGESIAIDPQSPLLRHIDDEEKRQEHLRKLGHFLYADRAVSEFVHELHARHPDSLFVITGDHYGRHHVRANPSLFERSAVPLVLYGPHVLADHTLDAGRAGHHADILPTLVELVAPAGFEYHTLGRNLLANDRAKHRYAFGDGVMIYNNVIIDTQHGEAEFLDGEPAVVPELLRAADQHYRQYQAIGWWRVRRGNALPVQESL